MRFEQTKTILQNLAPEYHRTVSRFYQDMADGEVSPRVRMMLDYLIDHEQQRAHALGEFCREASPHILEHWFKNVEISFPQARAETLEDVARTDLDQLIKAAVSYKTDLINYFAYLVDHSNVKESINLFQTLKIQEEKAMKRMIRHAQGLADL